MLTGSAVQYVVVWSWLTGVCCRTSYDHRRRSSTKIATELGVSTLQDLRLDDFLFSSLIASERRSVEASMTPSPIQFCVGATFLSRSSSDSDGGLGDAGDVTSAGTAGDQFHLDVFVTDWLTSKWTSPASVPAVAPEWRSARRVRSGCRGPTSVPLTRRSSRTELDCWALPVSVVRNHPRGPGPYWWRHHYQL